MDIGKGIAVAGIWFGVGFVSMHTGDAIVVVAIAAAAATVLGLLVWD